MSSKITMQVITTEQARQEAREAFALTGLTWEQYAGFHWCECGSHIDYDTITTLEALTAIDRFESLWFLIGDPPITEDTPRPAWLDQQVTQAPTIETTKEIS